MCVPREALISALASRAKRGERVRAEDVDALLRGGASAAQLLEAFAGEGEALEHARGIVARANAGR
jgi:hypothetical protein